MNLRPVMCLILLSAVAPLQAQRERLPPDDRELVEQRWPEAIRTSTSLRYIIQREGDTKAGKPEPGMVVSVLFKGWLLDGKVFDQSLDVGNPFKVKIGRRGLIDGWEQTITDMHKGEKRLVIVPYELGYGSKGRAPDIPRRATLVFEIELLDFGPE